MVNQNEMQKLENINEFYDYESFKIFDSLNERAKTLLYNFITRHHGSVGDIENLIITLQNCSFHLTDYKPSPLEQIFVIAFSIYLAFYSKNTDEKTLISVERAIRSQYPLKYKEKKYIVDFLIDFNLIDEDDDEYLLDKPYLRKHKYIIELDGHDYHSTKSQRTADYERENNLKELGYSVIRFTGSQVYNKPLSCVDKIINIISNDINKGDR